MAVELLVAVAAELALLQTAGGKLLEEAGLVLVHLVEGHLEPCGLVAVVVEHLGPSALVAVAAAVASGQIVVGKHLVEVVAVVEEHQEPYGLAVAVGEVEHQEQIFGLVVAAGQTVGQGVEQTVAAAVEGVVGVASSVAAVEGVVVVASVAAEEVVVV